MSSRGEVLVAIVNNQRDFRIAREQCWYRIPVDSAHKFLKNRWPPQWLAFYQTKDFMGEAYAVNYYAPVLEIREASREQLFPDEPPGSKSGKRYYQLLIESLQKLPKPALLRSLGPLGGPCFRRCFYKFSRRYMRMSSKLCFLHWRFFRASWMFLILFQINIGGNVE